MELYIKDMEMPVTCCHCPLMGYDSDIEWVDGGRETQGAYICVITHELIDNTKREDHCPLVPIPESHGRLIDAEQLKETLDYYIREAGWSDEINKALNWVKDEFINSAPTIIPESEVAD